MMSAIVGLLSATIEAEISCCPSHVEIKGMVPIVALLLV